MNMKDTINKKKKWLGSYRELMREVKDEADRAGFWREKAEGISAVVHEMTGVKSANRRTVYDCMNEFLELSEHCSRLGREADRKKDQILKAINLIEDPGCREVLKMYYISDRNLMQIAEAMHYSVGWIKTLHRRGLELLEIPKECTFVYPET